MRSALATALPRPKNQPELAATRTILRDDRERLMEVRVPAGTWPVIECRHVNPPRRLGNTAATVELLSTILLVRRMIDDGLHVSSRLVGFYGDITKGSRERVFLPFLSNVVDHNLRRNNFTGAHVCARNPTLVDELYSWKLVRVTVM